MNTLNNIVNYISGINPTISTISSIGSYISESNQNVSNSILKEVRNNIPQKSLAFKIATSNYKNFSEKQILVIAYELKNNIKFCEKVNNFYSELKRKSDAKHEASKNKLAANKENSQSVLDFIKNNGKNLCDYYKFVKSQKQFKSEFFSKKFSIESANSFLSI